jgi:hypothetical protein
MSSKPLLASGLPVLTLAPSARKKLPWLLVRPVSALWLAD